MSAWQHKLWYLTMRMLNFLVLRWTIMSLDRMLIWFSACFRLTRTIDPQVSVFFSFLFFSFLSFDFVLGFWSHTNVNPMEAQILMLHQVAAATASKVFCGRPPFLFLSLHFSAIPRISLPFLFICMHTITFRSQQKQRAAETGEPALCGNSFFFFFFYGVLCNALHICLHIHIHIHIHT